MKKRGIIIVFLLTGLAFAAYSQNAKQMIKAGQKFMAGQKYEAAVEQFTRAIDVDPNIADGYMARAAAYEALLKFNEAHADLEKALVFAPKNAEVLYRLGKMCNLMGRYDEAIVHLNRVTAIDKRHKTVYPEKVITLMGLGRHDQALRTSDTALLLKTDANNLYYRGLVYLKLNNDILAKKELEKSIAKDKNLMAPRIALVDVLIREGKVGEALGQCNTMLSRDDKNTAAYTARSKVYVASMDFPNAINDISKNIVIEPDNPDHYLLRGQYYAQFSQHSNAVNDFSKYITLVPDDYRAYFERAKAYEETMNYDRAIADYQKITELSEFNMEARKQLKEAEERLFELNRETTPPEINLVSPIPSENIINVRGDSNSMLITGKITDRSAVTLRINDEEIQVAQKSGVFEFAANVDVTGLNSIALVATDAYNNIKTMNFELRRTETNAPRITIVAPYASDNNVIYLDNNNQLQSFAGKITDDSRLKEIIVGGVTASYNREALNPTFNAANVDVLNKNKITVVAEDIYGNITETEFTLNRDAANLAQDNPMGKTWAVFIENSDYTTFASLEGPTKDINLMQRALGNYQIHNIIHKTNMTKQEMERFFSIELRDQIRENNVKSLMIWYAGHGKFINDVGYWIPVDARRDEEFTYFNINGLRAAMESYVNVITHLLVVTDACESGPSFYTAMRSEIKTRSCDDWQATQLKSSQVLTSAGYELAMDNSQFTQTFYNLLVNNPNACIPIDEIYLKVSNAHAAANQQKPKFGKITGLRDDDGTFFFIAK